MKLAVMAVSLGGVETLVEHPASTTHNDKCVPREVKIASGITDGLLRLRSGCVCVMYICDLDYDHFTMQKSANS